MENKKDNKTIVLNATPKDEKTSPKQESTKKIQGQSPSNQSITSAMQFTINMY